MHVDRLRFLVREGKWGLVEASELVKGAPAVLAEIERLREALKTISRGKSDGLDHAEDVRRLERARSIASNALRVEGKHT